METVLGAVGSDAHAIDTAAHTAQNANPNLFMVTPLYPPPIYTLHPTAAPN